LRETNRFKNVPCTLCRPGAWRAESWHASRADRHLNRAAAHLDCLQQPTGRSQPLYLRLRLLPLACAGFGSGKQLGEAISCALCCWHGSNLATPTPSAWLGRGLRATPTRDVPVALGPNGAPGALKLKPAPVLATLCRPGSRQRL